MDAQQELFGYFLVALRDAGYDVYDADLPSDDVPYPFIYIGPTQDVYEPIKRGENGQATITIDVWGDRWDQRGSFSKIVDDVKRKGRELYATNEWTWLMSACNSQILPDSSTSVPLMHGVIDLTFSYMRR